MHHFNVVCQLFCYICVTYLCNATLKNWIKIQYNAIFIYVLLLLIIINVIATITENTILLQLTKPLFVPAFLLYYFIKNKYINFVFIAFLLFSFLGDSSSVLFSSDAVLKASSLLYCLSYLCLVYVVATKFKRIEFDKIVGLYLLVVFLINVYFLYTLFNILQAIIPDSLEVTLFGIKSVSLIALAFVSFAVYLNSDTKRSILFLVTSLCFVFSDVLYYISNYYIYDWSFVMLDRLLHILGLFFLFNYIIEEYRHRKKRIVNARISSENVLI